LSAGDPRLAHAWSSFHSAFQQFSASRCWDYTPSTGIPISGINTRSQQRIIFNISAKRRNSKMPISREALREMKRLPDTRSGLNKFSTQKYWSFKSNNIFSGRMRFSQWWSWIFWDTSLCSLYVNRRFGGMLP
jgi:hypothetical protein